jgi:DNA-binding XRE family transcriptional regulator
MPVHLSAHSRGELVRVDKHAFAAKIRLARAVLDWSQSELGRRVGLTQRAIHKLEQGDTEPRRTTVRALAELWREQGIEFDELADGGFVVRISSAVLHRPAMARSRRQRAARTRVAEAIGHRGRDDRA